MPRLFAIHDKMLKCDLLPFLADDDGSASSNFSVWCANRPLGARFFELYCIGDVAYLDDQYKIFSVEREYIRSYSDEVHDEAGN